MKKSVHSKEVVEKKLESDMHATTCILYMREIIYDAQPRMLPCVLPHVLVQSLFDQNLWPTQLMPELNGEVRGYWSHMFKHAGWAFHHPGMFSHEPIAIYRDHAAVNKNGDKMCCITMSHVLDPRKSSMHTLWPLCVYKCDSCLHLLLKFGEWCLLKSGHIDI